MSWARPEEALPLARADMGALLGEALNAPAWVTRLALELDERAAQGTLALAPDPPRRGCRGRCSHPPA